ncbi:MAG: hypothetical protein ACXWK4_01625 [Myxococcaceae bacterium]
MSPRLRRCALCLALLSLPAVAGPPREDRRAARVRPSSVRTEREEPAPAPASAEVVAASAVDASGVDLAGFLGMLAALAVTYVYARGRRLPLERDLVRSSPRQPPPEPR